MSNQINNLDINIVNIHAGFDETSEILNAKFPAAKLTVLDFYNPLKHTEVSIKRARNAYKPFHATKQVITTNLQLPNKYADDILIVFAAHEIRNERERIAFFKEIKRIVKPEGNIIVVEHLRDLPNFLAYNIGFFHFLSRPAWYVTFTGAGLKVISEKKLTPFVNIFKLA
ncbi:class I SAM-dependent methyltransferase [Mucilaginibacter sp. RB4R14]|uniref:methyltransferase domain-containing protein n=1 Tax=Mucilaginibacter aurantiaciroseus TaxID=2949308 RepID=UPI002090B536|nr:class I SAM-dependent methyltransferase [Mucilaginibacter aurantiaciroseus]MCO5935136.1 class I SAM-dependent methyltransferase [Mucilaginibacter aurantiaciroseus]